MFTRSTERVNLTRFRFFIDSFIHFRYLYSAPSRYLLRGAPDYSAYTESEFHAEAHEKLRVKDFSRVPTRRLEVDSIHGANSSLQSMSTLRDSNLVPLALYASVLSNALSPPPTPRLLYTFPRP